MAGSWRPRDDDDRRGGGRERYQPRDRDRDRERDRDRDRERDRDQTDVFGRDLDRRRSRGNDAYDDERGTGKRARRDDGDGGMDYALPFALAPSNPADLLHGDVLLSFKQFLATQDSDVDPEKASAAYTAYKAEFATRNIQKTFTQHKSFDWFQEKYHPQRRAAREAALKQLAEAEHSQFMSECAAGDMNSLSLDKSPGGDDAAPDDGQAADGEDKSQPTETPIPGAPEVAKILAIKTIPPSISRQQIEEMCKKVDGFLYLELGDVNPQKKYHRSGWAYYKPDIDANAAQKHLTHTKIEGFEFFLNVHPCTLMRKVAVDAGFATPERKAHDFKQAWELVAQLDKEKGVSPSFTARVSKDVAPSEVSYNLDLLVMYLRQVHLFDYYSATECDSRLALLRRTGAEPERPAPKSGGSADALTKLDEQIAQRMQPSLPDAEYERLMPRDPQSEQDKGLQEYITVLEEGAKYHCTICSKNFKGHQFIMTHLTVKHAEKALALRQQAEMYNNFLRDPNRILLPAPTAPAAPVPLLPGGVPLNPMLLVPPMGGFGGFVPGPGGAPVDAGGYAPSGGHDDWRGNRYRPPFDDRNGPNAHQDRPFRRDDRDDQGDRRGGPRGPRPAPSGAAGEGGGRTVRSYMDLDAPPSDEIIDYRSIDV